MSCKIGLARSTTTGFMCQNAHHRGRDSSESCHGITKMWRAKAKTKLAKSISKCSPSSMARAISTTRNLWKDRYRCDGLQGQGRTTDPLDAMPGKEAPVSALRDSKTARFGATMLFEASRLLEIIPQATTYTDEEGRRYS
jgi:hypothetical protein